MVFSMYILRDVNVCIIALVYMDYLVFLRRLKHGGPWLGKLSLSAQKHHLWPSHLCPRRKNKVVGLREKPALGMVRDWLVLEVVGEGLR
jgi:hypothetical protein